MTSTTRQGGRWGADTKSQQLAAEQAVAHPDIRSFQSTGRRRARVVRTCDASTCKILPGTPVYSYLQPLSEYRLSVSYQAFRVLRSAKKQLLFACQDLFENPRTYVNLTLQTNFTVPGMPQAPTLKSRQPWACGDSSCVGSGGSTVTGRRVPWRWPGSAATQVACAQTSTARRQRWSSLL